MREGGVPRADRDRERRQPRRDGHGERDGLGNGHSRHVAVRADGGGRGALGRDVHCYETKSEYSLTVRATDTRGGAADASVRVVVRDVSENPPVALNNLSAAVSGTTVTLSWTKPVDDLITRRAQGSEAVATIKIKGASTTSCADSGLSANTKYIYRVHAIDYFNREGAAARTTATTGAAGG